MLRDIWTYSSLSKALSLYLKSTGIETVSIGVQSKAQTVRGMPASTANSTYNNRRADKITERLLKVLNDLFVGLPNVPR